MKGECEQLNEDNSISVCLFALFSSLLLLLTISRMALSERFDELSQRALEASFTITKQR